MIVVQLSDPHVTVEGDSPGAGVDSYASLLRAIERVSAIEPQPAAVVVSGDLVERGTLDEYRRLAVALAKVGAPVHLMTGNHDDRDALAEAFPHLAPRRGPWGLQYVVDVAPLRLVLLDSLVEGTAAGALDGTRLDWLDARLAEEPARPTIVFVHHPPVTTGLAHVDGSALSNGDALAAVVMRHRNVVRVASGHIHRSLATAFAGTMLTVCPSTAHQFELDLRDCGRIAPVRNGPAFHVHRYHAGSLFTYTVSID